METKIEVIIELILFIICIPLTIRIILELIEMRKENGKNRENKKQN